MMMFENMGKKKKKDVNQSEAKLLQCVSLAMMSLTIIQQYDNKV